MSGSTLMSDAELRAAYSAAYDAGYAAGHARGVEDGRLTQAILEMRGRDRFVESIKAEEPDAGVAQAPPPENR